MRVSPHKGGNEGSAVQRDWYCPCASTRSITVGSPGGSVRGSDEKPLSLPLKTPWVLVSLCPHTGVCPYSSKLQKIRVRQRQNVVFVHPLSCSFHLEVVWVNRELACLPNMLAQLSVNRSWPWFFFCFEGKHVYRHPRPWITRGESNNGSLCCEVCLFSDMLL